VLRRASLLVLIGLLTDVHPSNASWTTLTSLPEASFGAGAASQGGRLYLVGGFTTQISPGVVAWDGTSWGAVAPLLHARMIPGVAAARGHVFALGGFDENGVPTSSAESFDPLAGTWSGVADLPASRASCAAGAIGESLYVAGGQGDDGQPAASCFRFDPAADAWSAIASLPTPRTGVAGAVLDRRLWVIGGFDGQPSAVVERFDPETGSWSTASSLPEPLWFPAAGTLDGRVWVVGGMDASFQRSDRVYSAGSDGVWRSEGALPSMVAVASVGGLSNCLIVAGGMDASGQPSALAFSQCVEAPPPPPPPPAETLTVAISLNPTNLNASSNGQWVSAHVVPNGWPATDIVVASLRLDGVAPDMSGPISITETDLTVKFPRAAFADRVGGTYDLTLTGVTTNGTSFSGNTALTVQSSSLASKKRGLRPLGSGAASTGVVVSLDQAEPVRLDVIDLQGRIVARLYNGLLAPGEWRHEWPRAGQQVPRGTYFVRLARGAGVDVVRIAVFR
jgi:N-acetylneuraminic acid mutarotase